MDMGEETLSGVQERDAVTWPLGATMERGTSKQKPPRCQASVLEQRFSEWDSRASAGNLLEIQILGPPADLLNRELWRQTQQPGFS